MFNVNIDTSEINKLVSKIEGIDSRLEQSIKRYLKLLMGSGAISVEGTLKHKINELVYSTNDPKFYERTYSLFNATRVQLKGETVHLYIDDKWLGERPHVQESSLETGSASNARPGSPTPYSQRVEEDFEYKNMIGNDYNRRGSHYMRETFKQLVRDIQSGDKDASKIIQPILRSWSR